MMKTLLAATAMLAIPGLAAAQPTPDDPSTWAQTAKGVRILGGSASLTRFGGNTSALRMSFRARIHGALGDNGQSYKTLQYFTEALSPKAQIGIVFGCGMKQ